LNPQLELITYNRQPLFLSFRRSRYERILKESLTKKKPVSIAGPFRRQGVPEPAISRRDAPQIPQIFLADSL